MPLYDFTLSAGRVVTLYRPMAEMDRPVTAGEIRENGHELPELPDGRVLPAVRSRVPDRVALVQFKRDPHSQANQVLAGYREAEAKGKFKSSYTPEQIKRAWSDDRPQAPETEPETSNQEELILP
jgi:hypothetical protein